MQHIRPAAVAGTWYPDTAQVLTHAVDEYLSLASADSGVHFDSLTAVVAPHAGLIYSGPVAAYAYGLLPGRTFDVIVLVGPSHFVGFDGVAVYRAGGFQTPLGVAAIDERCTGELMNAAPIVREYDAAHAREHSLEMQLPFVQRLAPRVPIVPLVMGHQSADTARALGGALATVLRGRRALLVASTDLSHYHDALTATQLDRVVIDHVARFDADGLQRALDRTPGHACGGGPTVAVMRAAHALGARDARVLKYADSGDVSGDKSAVVGYMAAAFGVVSSPRRFHVMTNESDRQLLLRIARDAVVAHVAGAAPEEIEPVVLAGRRGGAFVSLHNRGGELRGCIGHIEPDQFLPDIVARCAVAACSADPRFPAVVVAELADLRIELSLLGPLEPIAGAEEIEIGRHGLVIEKDGRRGLLLPQVATEWKWDRQQFLAQTCRKAGLPQDDWKRGARIWRFEAEVFGEDAEAPGGSR